MSNYISIKRIPQDKSDPIFDVARKEFDKLEIRLRDYLKQAIVKEKDGLELDLIGVKDHSEFAIYIYPGGEVFSRKINGSYETFQTAYDFQTKKELLTDLINEAESFLKRDDYHEEIYEKNGRVIFRKIIYGDGKSEAQSAVFGGRVRKNFGAKKRLIKPFKKKNNS
jgi:hypothetical protein